MSDTLSNEYHSAQPGEPLLPPLITRAAAATVFLALVAGMAAWAYQLGTRDAAEVPIIRALEGPARVQPEDPGGLETAHQGLEMNAVLAGTPEPAPIEAPTIAAPAVTLTEEDGPQGELVLAAPEFPTVLPDEGEELRMPREDEGPLPSDTAVDAPMETDIAALMPDLIAEALAAGGASEDEAAQASAAPRPRNRPSGLVVRPAAPPAPAVTARREQPAPAPASPPAPASEVTSVGAGTRLVQLGAFDNEALARRVWDQLVARNGDLLGGKSLFLERATHNARVFYRLRVAGFQNTDQTRVLCEALRGRGVDCIPVTLQ